MRTTKGAARNRAKNRLFKKAKGYVGGRRRLLRTAKENLVRAGVYAYRDRRNRKRDFRRLWIIRINAAVRAFGLRYSEFIAGLEQGQHRVGPQDPGRHGRGRSARVRDGRRAGQAGAREIRQKKAHHGDTEGTETEGKETTDAHR